MGAAQSEKVMSDMSCVGPGDHIREIRGLNVERPELVERRAHDIVADTLLGYRKPINAVFRRDVDHSRGEEPAWVDELHGGE